MMNKELLKKRLQKCQEMLLQQDIEIGVKLLEDQEAHSGNLVCQEIHSET